MSSKTKPVTKSQILTLTKAYAAAWTAKDPFALAQLFEPEATWIINGTPATDPKAIADAAAGFFTLLPDLHFMADDTRTSGPKAVLTWTLYGHHAKTNTFTKLSGWDEWQVSPNGKLQSARMFYDPADLPNAKG